MPNRNVFAGVFFSNPEKTTLAGVSRTVEHDLGPAQEGEGMVRKMELGRRVLLGLASLAVGAMVLVATPERVMAAPAQAAPAQPAANDLTGTWQGTLHAGRDLRIVVKITKAADGKYKAQFYSIDQSAQLPVDSVTLNGSTVTMTLSMIGGKFEGTLSKDGKTIDGTWSQGPTPLPLALARATAETAWTIPAPPPPIPPMADNANPSFEVATIKPSKPGQKGKGFGFNGHEVLTINTNLDDLLALAYGVHTKQIVNAPGWANTDLYDVVGLPDAPGRPDIKQMGIMVQKLLVNRFQLKIHRETRVLSVYAITVVKDGPKLTKDAGPANGTPAFFFTALGDLHVRNMTMKDFASWMQASVLDRPVVDQTGLAARYDFTLNWTPDDSQFTQFRGTGVVVPPNNNAANAPPNLYTAIQQQLGLKIEATKAPDEVIVIDHVDHPSPN